MRTNIDVREALLAELKLLSQIKSQRMTIEKSIEALINYLKRREMLTLRGKVQWEGDLNEMRQD